ncbi:MAG: hypothetical protein NC102_00220 [Clostridium sp.]|nr:hypothetical protein [Clostridium sp.]
MEASEDPDVVFKYFRDYVNRGFSKIFNEQRRIAAAKIYGKQAHRTDGTPRSRSGRLQRALESPSFSLSGSGSSLSASARYPAYIRFLDMKRLGNYRIYNRPIWGILYKETFRDLRYEFYDWLEKFVKKSISGSYQQA